MSRIGTLWKLARQEGKPRTMKGYQIPAYVVLAGTVGLTIYVLVSQYLTFPNMLVYRGVFLSVILALTFLVFTPTQRESPKPSVADYVMAVLALSVGAYLVLNEHRIMYRVAFLDSPATADPFFAGLMILLALEAARRTVGYQLSLICIAALTYMFSSNAVPGMFHVAGGVPISKAVDSLFLTTGGLFGIPSGVLSTYIFPFGIFGAFLTLTGVGDYLFDFSRFFVGRFRGGIAKAACVGSSLFGMINGSPVANVATVGAITIPMMIKSGYSAKFAVASEAVASTGGAIMPPIMGAVAFVMAEVIGVPYIEVAIAAAIPAVLYYLAVFIAIDTEAQKLGLKGIPKEELPKFWPTIKKLLPFILPIGWLVFRLLQHATPTRAGFESAGLIIIAALFTQRRLGPWKILKGIEQGVRSIMVIGPAIIVAGVIQGTVQATGAGGKFTSLIFSVGGHSLLAAAIITAVVAILLGLGLEITPTYILTVALAAPSLMLLGVGKLEANFFVMYGATMAVITPPVALSVYTAAGIAGINFWAPSWTAMRMAVVAYVLPFAIIYRPEILMIGKPLAIILTAINIAFAVAFMQYGIFRHFFIKNHIVETVLLIVVGLGALFVEVWWINVMLLSIGLFIGAEQLVRRRRMRAKVATIEAA